MSITAQGLLIITTGNINSAPIEGPWGLVILGSVVLMSAIMSVMIFIIIENIWKNDDGLFRIVFLVIFGLIFLAVIAVTVLITVIALRGYL